MTTIVEKLRAAFTAADKLNEALWHSGIESAYMSVEEFAEHATKVCGVEINFKLVDVDTEHVYGHIERYDEGKRATIYIVKNISPRWKRVVGTKEICHIVLDAAEDMSVNGADTLERLVLPLIEHDAPENAAVRSENLAEICAWELLYPHEFRKRDIKRLDANETNLEALSHDYRIPAQITEMLLSPAYIQWCDRWWDYIFQERTAKSLAKIEAETEAKAAE